MNFFEQQDRARHRTTRLVVLFTLAVVCIVAAVNVAVALVLNGMSQGSGTDPQVHLIVSAAVLGVIVLGSLYKAAMLSGGGAAVAQSMGGRLVLSDTSSNAERMLLNVVEEMSLASGVPVPNVYIMDEEDGINAFAAGYRPDHAIVAVTRGALEKLTRDELQGVIGHEFSHILNGDMRLNIRLIALLNGILVISLIGYMLIRAMAYARPSSSSRRNDKDNSAGALLALMLLGVALYVIGWVGVFFGRLIQAAVSRQREFLADASAVQFTRNPHGLAGALKKLGAVSQGSKIHSAHSMELAHLFFGSAGGMSFARWLATHPPLDERIRAIEPSFDGRFEPVAIGADQIVAALTAPPIPMPFAPSVLTGTAPPPLPVQPGQIVEQAARPRPEHITYAAAMLAAIPPEIDRAARDPFSARCIGFALLMGRESEVQAKQTEILRTGVDATALDETIALLGPIHQMGETARLTLLELSMPALRRMSGAQVEQFKGVLKQMIEADGRVTLFEYAMFRILRRSLRTPDQPAPRTMVQFYSLRAVLEEAVTLLAALARLDSKSGGRSAEDFAAGARLLGWQAPLPAESQRPSFKDLDAALLKLSASAPAIKKRVIEAASACVAADGTVGVQEAELLRAVAATLDIPLPPFLPMPASQPATSPTDSPA